jgi:hypothetical protein
MPPDRPEPLDDAAYRVRLEDPDGTSHVIFGAPDDDDDPTATGTFEYTAADPVLAELARNPYDPLVAARAGGRLMGLAVTQPQNEPWMRVIGGFLGLALFVVGLLAGWRWSPLALIFAAVGLLMLWRALPTSPRA